MSMERYVAAFVACSGDADESLDRAVAARILPSVLVLTKDVNAGLGDEIEKIFGDSGAEASRRAVRTAELNKTVKNPKEKN